MTELIRQRLTNVGAWGSLSLSMDSVSRLWELVFWKLLCPALS